MKKVLFALACFVSSFFFASCTQEQFNDFLEKKPNISFVEEEGYISNNNSVLIGTELSFKIKASPNAGSKSPLARIVFTITDINGKIVKESRPTIQDPTVETVFTESFTTDKASTYAITATVTDEAGKVNIAEVIVTYIEPVTAEIGVFKGNFAITGRVTTDGGILPGTAPIDEPLSINDIVTEVSLGSLDNDSINAMINIDGTPVGFRAALDNNNLTFDEFVFKKGINISGVDIDLDLTINMTGVLEEDTLTLNGTATGEGAIKVLGLDVHVNLTEGNITGVLQKEE